MEIVKLTGNYYLKKRFFGGYNIMVEVVGRYFCERDFSYSPEFKTYIKATDEHLIELNVKII
mgnify:FL=1